ncbi:MAG: 3'-5' exonuclease [Rikenellaceae bacterium]
MAKFRAKIENDEILELLSAWCEGEVIVVDNNDHDFAADYLSQCSVLGFDTETRPSFKKGVNYPLSLLQLSGDEKTFLFRVDRIKLSNRVVRLLRSKSIIKVGADIKEDIRKLQEIVKFTPEGFVDLQKIAIDYGIEEKSLKKLTAIVLGRKLSKAQRLSNWSAKTLTEQQITYAATDSYVSREIYLTLLDSEYDDDDYFDDNEILDENFEEAETVIN